MTNSADLAAFLRATLTNSADLASFLRATLTKSADPDQLPQNAASDQGLHCLLAEISIIIFIKMKTIYLPATLKAEIGLVQLVNGTFHLA